MALPKEPRQKMINMMYLVLTALLALNVSAEILNAFKVVDKSLMNSSANIDEANKTLYSSLKEKLADPKTAEKAKIWEPKAEQAQKLSDNLTSYLDGLKLELKKAAELKIEDGKEHFREDNLEAATNLFANQGKGPELQQKLIDYKAAMLAIDPEIKTKFEKTLPIDTESPTNQEGAKQSFTTGYFHMVPTVAALTLLSKFQNNVKNAENQVVSFCHEQIGAVKIKFDQASVLVGQSSNYVMPGQEVVITAGIGSYSSAAAPKVSINGSSVPVTAGRATSTITASGAGAHKVPISITYLDQDGITQTKTEEIEYVVGTPSGAAVMLDKMNVFYIGVDNPVTISSGTGWDKTNVSMSGGVISGSNSNRTVRVTTPGTATINVTADGKTNTFKFRVKEIPNPIFKVGPGGTRMTSGTFKSQQFCRAELENFEFDTHFSVLSATVYFSGAGFASVAQGKIEGGNLSGIDQFKSRCMPGSSITFDNVKVQGPDGKQRTIQGVGISLY